MTTSGAKAGARTGGCHCGAVRYEVTGHAAHHAICHCDDCRASSGAPMVAWYAVGEDQFRLTAGEPTVFEGATGAERAFCPRCGTGLFYRNAQILPGIVDIQSATFDDPAEQPPTIQIQCAERLPWVTQMAAMPEFARYPEE
ncbi:hypothetical protein NT2_04_03920 [Caenibius tardaugens NBRC 16725]|uniref:CENP-V/GFA domain-containing protein n=1 Tax=Caenibius tardaugens NBRC 16725 TaxID=1219035 RepID=U2ZUC6_9SPHN|nr:GFA family protein [Caenibius tardaugens]AZI35965.1 GFA family protein [Caenibius tardaugens NBRC 16725]GAD48979.1 hypothetical protein NT2_04_03920 [Caenibius tardaugens NBRC 16725]